MKEAGRAWVSTCIVVSVLTLCQTKAAAVDWQPVQSPIAATILAGTNIHTPDWDYNFITGDGGHVSFYNPWPVPGWGLPAWWSLDTGSTVALRAVWGTDLFNVYYVGDNGTILHTAPGETSIFATIPEYVPVSVNLHDIWGSSENDIFAAPGKAMTARTIPTASAGTAAAIKLTSTATAGAMPAIPAPAASR